MVETATPSRAGAARGSVTGSVTGTATGPGTWAHEGIEVSPGRRLGGMTAPAELLPTGVLPTAHLNAKGRPLPPLRDELRRIPNARNAANVVSVWIQSFGLIAFAIVVDRPIVWLATYVLMGRAFALFAILTHEAAHRLLFSKKAVNDFVGRWLLGYPAFVPIDIYRRVHMAHHRVEFGPDEPDMAFYANYPTTRSSLRRKLTRDLFFVSGWKNLRPLVSATRHAGSRPLALRILGTQAVIATVLTVAGAWWVYPIFWLAPWMSVWRVINRLRSIAEHGGLEQSEDRRKTTHHVRQNRWARFWMVPYKTGYHLAHHVDSGVPFQHLPALHRELDEAGWITPELTYPNYRALWSALASAR